MASSKREKDGAGRDDIAEGTAKPDVPKTTRSVEERLEERLEELLRELPEPTKRRIPPEYYIILRAKLLADDLRTDPETALESIARSVITETDHKWAAVFLANFISALRKKGPDEDDYVRTIFELVRSGDEESLRKAIESESGMAFFIIVNYAHESCASKLASLLRKQVSSSLWIAEALTCLAEDPHEAIDFVLREGVVLTELEHCLIIRSFGSMDPLVVMPSLVRFLRVAPGGTIQNVLATIEDLILNFQRRFTPSEARHRREITLSQLAELLNDDRTLSRSVKEAVVGIILRRAKYLGDDVDVVVVRLAEAWKVSVEEAGWRLCGEVLTNPESRQAEWQTAVEWYLGRKHEESRWRVYRAIVERSTEPEHRIKAVRHLGAEGPTATARPLSSDVKEIRDWLLRLAERAEDQRLRDEATEALNQNIARGKEEAPPTRPPSLTEEVRTRELGTVDAGLDTPEQGGKRPTTVSEMPELVEGTLPARSTAEVLLADLEQTQTTLAELHAPIVEKLRSTLERLHEVRSFGSYAENAKAAAMVYRLAKSCGVDLTYNGERVALGCVDREDYKAGVFRLRTFSGKPKFVYDRRDFPPLDLTPSDDPSSP